MIITPYMIKLVVLSVLACQIHAAGGFGILDPFMQTGTPGSYNNFKLEGEYGSLSQRVHKAATRGAEKISSDCSVLKQTCSCDLYPRCHLQGLSCSGDEQTVLAFRLDTLDMIGFTNKTGHWHSFEGSEHLIPGSTGLGFRNDYGSLIGGHMELTKVSVERSSILGAAGILSIHDPNTAVEEEIKLALANLRIITSEALRFTRIKEQVSLGWDSEESLIRAEDAQYVPMWREISEALLSWKETGSWGGEHARSLSNVGIHDEEEALNLVRLVCAPPPETWKPHLQQ